MTVKDLKAILEKYDDSAEVVISRYPDDEEELIFSCRTPIETKEFTVEFDNAVVISI